MLHYTTSNFSILQRSHWIRRSQPEKIQELKQIASDDSTFGVGKMFCHSLPIWRKIIRQTCLAGLLRRNMKTDNENQCAMNILFNVFTPTEEGTNYALNPSLLPHISFTTLNPSPLLPSFNPPATDQDVNKAQTKNAAKHRMEKGAKYSLSSQRNWYSIRDPSDYYLPGVFKTWFCDDITNLSQYSSSDFLFHDIQLGKDKIRNEEDQS